MYYLLHLQSERASLVFTQCEALQENLQNKLQRRNNPQLSLRESINYVTLYGASLLWDVKKCTAALKLDIHWVQSGRD